MVIEDRGNAHRVRRLIRRSLILAAGLMALAVPCTAVEYAGGTGEPNDPYLIATAEQLLAADVNVPGLYFRLSNDIDLGRKGVGKEVCAHLDGAGFAIRNAAALGGVFAYVASDGTITNLTLASFDVGAVSAPGFVGVGGGSIGGLVAVNEGTISNCRAIGWVVTSGYCKAGGLVGDNLGSISNCYFDGWVVSDWKDEITEGNGYPNSGGLVGFNRGSITNSFTRGLVIGTFACGGLAGANGGTIRNCYSTCTVIGDVGAGGLVAENWDSLRTCYASGLVIGQLRGGLLGMAGYYPSNGTVTNCLWDVPQTDCARSGAGVEIRGSMDAAFALNGWAGDPNWVMTTDVHSRDSYSWLVWDGYPRLAWEGTPGPVIAEYSASLFLVGSGTQSDPYVITQSDQLEYLSRASIYWDKHFVLGNDIESLSRPYTPIGICQGSSFSGTFDGNGHAIRRLLIHREYPDYEAAIWNFGLFGYVTGEIRNLILEDCRVEGGERSRGVGLLAGTSEGVIENCSVTGSITVGEDSRFIGGLIGVDLGQITDCEATVTIKAGEGSRDIGELVGTNEPWR